MQRSVKQPHRYQDGHQLQRLATLTAAVKMLMSVQCYQPDAFSPGRETVEQPRSLQHGTPDTEQPESDEPNTASRLDCNPFSTATDPACGSAAGQLGAAKQAADALSEQASLTPASAQSSSVNSGPPVYKIVAQEQNKYRCELENPRPVSCSDNAVLRSTPATAAARDTAGIGISQTAVQDEHEHDLVLLAMQQVQQLQQRLQARRSQKQKHSADAGCIPTDCDASIMKISNSCATGQDRLSAAACSVGSHDADSKVATCTAHPSTQLEASSKLAAEVQTSLHVKPMLLLSPAASAPDGQEFINHNSRVAFAAAAASSNPAQTTAAIVTSPTPGVPVQADSTAAVRFCAPTTTPRKMMPATASMHSEAASDANNSSVATHCTSKHNGEEACTDAAFSGLGASPSNDSFTSDESSGCSKSSPSPTADATACYDVSQCTIYSNPLHICSSAVLNDEALSLHNSWLDVGISRAAESCESHCEPHSLEPSQLCVADSINPLVGTADITTAVEEAAADLADGLSERADVNTTVLREMANMQLEPDIVETCRNMAVALDDAAVPAGTEGSEAAEEEMNNVTVTHSDQRTRAVHYCTADTTAVDRITKAAAANSDMVRQQAAKLVALQKACKAVDQEMQQHKQNLAELVAVIASPEADRSQHNGLGSHLDVLQIVLQQLRQLECCKQQLQLAVKKQAQVLLSNRCSVGQAPAEAAVETDHVGLHGVSAGGPQRSSCSTTMVTCQPGHRHLSVNAVSSSAAGAPYSAAGPPSEGSRVCTIVAANHHNANHSSLDVSRMSPACNAQQCRTAVASTVSSRATKTSTIVGSLRATPGAPVAAASVEHATNLAEPCAARHRCCQPPGSNSRSNSRSVRPVSTVSPRKQQHKVRRKIGIDPGGCGSAQQCTTAAITHHVDRGDKAGLMAPVLPSSLKLPYSLVTVAAARSRGQTRHRQNLQQQTQDNQQCYLLQSAASNTLRTRYSPERRRQQSTIPVLGQPTGTLAPLAVRQRSPPLQQLQRTPEKVVSTSAMTAALQHDRSGCHSSSHTPSQNNCRMRRLMKVMEEFQAGNIHQQDLRASLELALRNRSTAEADEQQNWESAQTSQLDQQQQQQQQNLKQQEQDPVDRGSGAQPVNRLTSHFGTQMLKMLSLLQDDDT